MQERTAPDDLDACFATNAERRVLDQCECYRLTGCGSQIDASDFAAVQSTAADRAGSGSARFAISLAATDLSVLPGRKISCSTPLTRPGDQIEGACQWRFRSTTGRSERAKSLIWAGSSAVEHVTFNHGVPGSIPGRLTTPFSALVPSSRRPARRRCWRSNFAAVSLVLIDDFEALQRNFFAA